MKILGIETSCDETALAIVEASGGLTTPKFKVIKNLVSSQIKIHRPFGGVVPNLAKREHLKNLPILFKKLCPKPYTLNADVIAVTVGPGLEPALWTGITFAEELAKKYKKPLVGANHLEGHLYSFLLPSQKKTVISKFKFQSSKIFPAVALIVSGGHTILLKLSSLSKWKKLGQTRDDAAGECFDKVARLLKLPYPGGPEVQRLAARGDCFAITFPEPMRDQKNYDFSFSGLKTSVLYYLRDHPRANKADIAASFEKAVTGVLSYKALRAAREYNAKSIILCGGVAANMWLQKKLREGAEKSSIQFLVPDYSYNTDNAVMIATAGYMAHLRKKKSPFKANGNLGI